MTTIVKQFLILNPHCNFVDRLWLIVQVLDGYHYPHHHCLTMIVL